MAYYTFISQICRDEASQHSQIEVVEKLARQIETTQTIDNLDSFPGNFVKKDFGRSFRLIIGKVYDQEDCLLIFWHFWPKSNDEYSEFQKKSGYYRQQFDNKFSPSSLADIWILKRQSPDVTPPSDLTEAERAFLFKPPVLSQVDEDWIVLESPDWLDRIYAYEGRQGSRDFKPYLSQLHDMVLTSLSESDGFVHSDTVGVLYHRFESQKILYLIAPVYCKDTDDIQSLKSKYQRPTDVSLEQSVQNNDNLLRAARRAYPALILADEALWINEIQKQDEKANLALSREEAELLQQQSGFYPLFINGRPGSGKSTVLQYLFAQYLLEYSQQPDAIAPPVYLTYSRELLDAARTTVVKLLSSNALLIQENRIGAERARQLADETFYVFRDYLLKLLPDSERFHPEKYIHYPRFRRLYEDKYRDARLRNMAEIAWHVIRTYIKGCAAEGDEFMSPDAYREFPRKQRSVTQEIFEQVHKQIWEGWYSSLTQQEGYWDDQDLTRAALQAIAEGNLQDWFRQHSVVFCDEAQDFTRNELRLILRLSAFSRRRLTPDVLERIPFAFAGDPFQTLNPTGFDWERAKENLYWVIRNQLDTRENPRLEFNYRELAFNYRSANSIVQVGNFIHLLRGIAFQRKGLTPQNTWFNAPSAMPVYYDSADLLARTHLPRQDTDVLIVPCHEGEELEYVRSDSFLKSFALSDDGQALNRNVLSPMRAKGQEFDRVVLYGFGEACLHDEQYRKLLDVLEPSASRPAPIAEDEQIPLEYFINRLYVAASRAKKRLIIVDTRQGLEKFWRLFYDAKLEEFVRRYEAISKNDASQWDASRHLIRIQAGTAAEWEKDLNNPLELAREFMEKGNRREDAYLLERAAQNFRLAQDEVKAVECDARACEIKGQFAEAGEKYQELGSKEQAEKCYWKARAYDRICSLSTNSLRSNAAQFMQALLGQQDIDLAQVRKLHDRITGAARSDFRPDDVWSEVLTSIYKYFGEKVAENDLRPFEWEDLYQHAHNLLQSKVLSSSGETQRRINVLRVRSVVYPEKLDVLKQIDAQPKEIADLYLANQDVALQSTQAEIVFRALRRLGKYREAEMLLQRYPSIDAYVDLISTYLQNKLFKNLEDLLTSLLSTQIWSELINAVLSPKFSLFKDLLEQLENHTAGNELDTAFIKALSVSSELSNMDNFRQSRISDYLQKVLLGEKAATLHSLLTVAQAGAALERANKIIDCLRFYEMVWREQTWPACDEDILLARHRWLVCKQRQKDFLAQSAEDKERIQQEIRSRQREWGIRDISALPEYPVVDLNARPRLPEQAVKSEDKPVKPAIELSVQRSIPRALPEDILLKRPASSPKRLMHKEQPGSKDPELKEPEQTAEQSGDTSVSAPISIQITVSGQTFLVEVSRQRDKMTIKKLGEVEMGTLIAKGLKMQGSDDEFHSQIEKRVGHRDNARYFIRPWNLTCVLRHRDGRVAVSLYLGDREVELCSMHLKL